MKLKEAFWDEIEEQAKKDACHPEPDFPTEEVEKSNTEPYLGDDEPAF